MGSFGRTAIRAVISAALVVPVATSATSVAYAEPRPNVNKVAISNSVSNTNHNSSTGASYGSVTTPGTTPFPGLPLVTGLDPAYGPPEGGNTVTIYGSGLRGATAVYFGQTPARSFTVVSDTQLRAVAPAGSDTVPVVVVTPAGRSSGGAESFYTYLGTPVISSVNPTQGTTGQSVVIYGSSFRYATDVLFDSTPTQFYTVSDNQIVAVVPSGSGTATIRVVNALGRGSGSVRFTYQ